MKKLLIRLHSFVGLITNSSTEIYTTCTEKSVDMVKEFISEVLRAAKSDKTVDELFDVRCYMVEYDEENDEYPDYEHLDFHDEARPVFMNIVSKSDNTDITNLVTDIFEQKEFLS
jgi:hypothetical protein